MKKIIISIILILISNAVFSQKTEPTQSLTKNDYLQKSKDQKMAAWLLLGAGAAATIGGAIWFGNEFNLFDNDNTAVPAVLTLAGILSMGGSIPLFIASSRNKNKALAMTAMLKIERSFGYQQKGIVHNNYPALSVRIHFK
jgi:hypothetical protein